MNRVVVTLVGKDHTGIIAAVCNYFAKNDINILDIKQTTVQEYINMMMIVDTEKSKAQFSDIVIGLEEVGKTVGCTIRAQKEDIFDMMHRL